MSKAEKLQVLLELFGWLSAGLAMLFCMSVAFTQEFSGFRKRIAALFEPNPYSPEVRKAINARTDRLNAYVSEYLTYGYDIWVAREKAHQRIIAEANVAEGVK